MSAPKLPVIFLLGPTASGKTDWAIHWHQILPNIEIISVDSVMIYRGCDIGSAKPSQELLEHHPHHLINAASLSEVFTVADFYREARRLIDEIHQRQKIPLLVGGSMMYFNVLKKGMSVLPESDAALRLDLENSALHSGTSYLYKELLNIDPIAAQEIKSNDKQRIIRAIEVNKLSGKTLQENLQSNPAVLLSSQYTLHELAIHPQDRTSLHQRIESRQKQLIASGLLEEVEQLNLSYPTSHDHPAMRAVNYSQALQVIKGTLPADELFERSLYATRQLAKRQHTWLRSWENLHNFDVSELEAATNTLKNLLNLR